MYANCVAHPNAGLVNALHHLIANRAKHLSHEAAKHQPGSQGNGHSADAVHGKSGQPHGHGNGHSKH